MKHVTKLQKNLIYLIVTATKGTGTNFGTYSSEEVHMKSIKQLLAVTILTGLYVGCSPVRFSLDDSQCKDNGCIVVDGKYSYDYSATAGAGKVDILIVDDNSASMSFEQARIAPRFANFIQNLDARNIDYRIAITTTDMSGGNYPQGGQLIQFADGSNYLTPNNSQRLNLFNSAIQRPETIACENFIANWFRSHNIDSQNTSDYQNQYKQNCPSGDERGIYSANLIVKNNPSYFIRSDAHLSIIFLSDEDVRSSLYTSNTLPLETLDKPESLLEAIKLTYGPEKYNSVSVHAIVVKDTTCLNIQNTQVLGTPANNTTQGLIGGSIGTTYLQFSGSSWGVAADICSQDYTTQLGAIQTRLENQIKEVMINCSNPTNLRVTVSGNPISYTLEGKVLKFQGYIQAGSKVNLSYQCSSQ